MSRLTLFRVGFLFFLILFFTTTAKSLKKRLKLSMLTLLSMNIINVVKNTC